MTENIKRQDIEDLAKSLVAAAKHFHDFVKDEEDEIPFEEIREEVSKVEIIFSDIMERLVERDSASFSEFLKNVGESFIAAQGMLDTKSKEYLLENAGKEYIPPTVFRIPKISADIKFALETSKDAGFNLLFFKNTEVSKTQHQQSVQFEMLTVPPPVEAMNKLSQYNLRLDLVLLPTRREEIFSSIREAKPNASEDVKNDIKQILNVGNKNKVLINEGGGEGRYFLLYAYAKNNKNFALWHLNQKDNTFSLVYRYKEEDRDQLKPLKSFALGLVEQQVKLMNMLVDTPG